MQNGKLSRGEKNVMNREIKMNTGLIRRAPLVTGLKKGLKMNMKTALVTAVVFALAAGGLVGLPGTVSAHASLESGQPVADAIVGRLPDTVVLRFTEPVEVRASIFKVYPLEPDEDPLRLKARAAKLVDEVLQLRGDEAARADAGLRPAGRESAEIQIILKEELPPGPYVVMWRVLSVDTHITWGHYVFTYAPADGD